MSMSYGYCFKADDRQDSYAYKYTSAEVSTIFEVAPELSVIGGTYTPEIINHSAISVENAKISGDIDIEIQKNNPVVDLLNDGMPHETIEFYLLAKKDGQVKVLFAGTVKSCSLDAEIATIHCSSILSKLTTQIPKIQYQKTCPWPLYSKQCNISRNDWHLTNSSTNDGLIGTISDDGLTITSPAFALKPDGWLSAGVLLVEKVAGSGIHLKRTIIEHTGSTVKLLAPLSHDLLGAQFLAYAGCDRAHETCKAKFNNVANFGGCPWIPGKNVFVVGIFK